MANFKKKKTDLYPKIIAETEIDICSNNLITFSIDSDLRYINYMIKKEDFKKYMNKISIIFNKDKVELKEVQELLKDEIYPVYKTKVSLMRVPHILLNILVKEELLYSDNCVDYEIKKNINDLNIFIKKYTKVV